MVRDRINYLRWLLAVLRAQNTGNLDTLGTMFRSNSEIRDRERKLLADLCDRGQFKKKRGGQLTPIGKRSPKARRALLADQVRRLQTGEFRLIEELLPDDFRAFGQEIKFKDSKSVQHYADYSRSIRKLRDAHGRMRRDDAIRLTAEREGIEPNTLADDLNLKSGSSRGGWKRWPSKSPRKVEVKSRRK
jgi:hypothetical protein